MINVITSYVTNPIYDVSSVLSRSAFYCIQPAHQLSLLINRDNTASFQMDSSQKGSVPSFRYFKYTHFQPSYTLQKLEDRIERIALLTLYSIAAIPLSLIALIFHRCALYKNPSLKKASDELETFKNDKAYYFALKDDEVSLKNEIEKSNGADFERFISETSHGWSVLSRAQEKSWDRIIILLIEKCPQRHLNKLKEPNKDGLSLMRWAIDKGYDNIIEACEVKGLNVTLVLDAAGRGIIDTAILNGRDLFAYRFMQCTAGDQLHLLFGNKANYEQLPYHFKNEFMNKLKDIFENDPEKLKKMLLHKRKDGKTLLHRQNFLSPLSKYLDSLGIDESKVLNDDGLSPKELRSRLSLKWLQKPKFLDRNLENIPPRNYTERATNLHREVLEIWDSLSFGTGDGEVNPNILFASRGGVFTKDQIKQHLNIMLMKINSEEAWLGTPRSDDVVGLHLFYCQMLINFERVVAELKKSNSPQKSANFLVDIAKTSLAGRCASAYQEEIDQKALLCNNETVDTTYEKIFEKAICAALQGIIVKIVSEKYDSDVHVWRQMNYACGLSKIPDGMGNDRLNPRYLQQVQEVFEITSFLQKIGNDIPLEAAADYLKETIDRLKPIGKVENVWNWAKGHLPTAVQQMMPESIKKRYREAINFAAKKEETLYKQAIHQLKSLAKDAKAIPALFEAIQNVRSVNLCEISLKETLIKKIIREESEKLEQLVGCRDLGFVTLHKKAKGDYEQLKKELITLLKEKDLYKGRIPLQIGQFFILLKKRIETAKKFQEAVIPLLKNKQSFSKILEIQNNYHKGLLQLVKDLKSFNAGQEEELELDFDHNTYLLPTQAIDQNYRIYEATPDLGHKNRMILKILLNQKIIQEHSYY